MGQEPQSAHLRAPVANPTAVWRAPLPPYARVDAGVANWAGGSGFSIPRLLPLLIGYDARKVGLDIRVPFFVVQGRDDCVTPFDAAEAFVAEARAPRKQLVPIAGGHFACFTDSKGFVGALRQYVRPIAQ